MARVKIDAHCDLCALSKRREENHAQITKTRVATKRPIIAFVTEAPSDADARCGQLFSDRAGHVLQQALNQAGISVHDCAFLSLVKCAPVPRKPASKAQIRTCRQFLDVELQALKPAMIVGLGNAPCRELFGLTAITKVHGTFKVIKIGGKKFVGMPTMNPLWAMVDLAKGKRDRLTTLINDLSKAYQLAKQVKRKGLASLKSHNRYYLADTVEKVQALCEKLHEAPVFAFDTETTGLQPQTAHVLGISFSFRPHEGFYVPLAYARLHAAEEPRKKLRSYWSREDREKVLVALRDVMVRSKVNVKIAHNLKFDLLMLWQLFGKMPVARRWEDTMLMANLLNETRSAGLDGLSSTYFPDLLGYKSQVRAQVSKKHGYRNIPLDELWPYACTDTDATLRLFKIFKKEMLQPENEGVAKLYRRFVAPACVMLTKMEHRGLTMDVTRVTKLRQIYEAEARKLQKKLEKSSGISDFSVHKNAEVLSLVKRLGVREDELLKTDTGQLSVSEKSLESLVKKHKALQMVVDLRSCHKNISTYVDGYMKHLTPDGRLHANFSQLGTRTGRLSCSNPNLQNIKKEQPILEMFCAGPKQALVYADYKQAEYRMMSWAADEKAILAAWERDVDFHRLAAAAMFHCEEDEVVDKQRSAGKTFNFALIYGASAQGLSYSLGISEKEAQQFIDNYFSRFPGVKRYLDETIAFCRENGYVVNPYGRRRHIPAITSWNNKQRAHAEHQAVNAPIQSGTWDYVSMAMCRLTSALEKESFDAGIVVTVHDSVIVECPWDKRKYVLDLMKATLEQPVLPVTVPMRVDIAAGKRWGEFK